ncbi:DYW domain-containing protein [Plasmodiophora brassicae]
MRRPSMLLAVRTLQQDDDPGRGWAVVERVLDMGLSADIRFYMTAMSFCRRCLPSKAAHVLRAAVTRGVQVTDALFCALIGACQRTQPIQWQVALDLYLKFGPRSPMSLFGIVNMCRLSGRAVEALQVADDALHRGADLNAKTLSLFAACCGEHQSDLSARVAERLLQVACRQDPGAVPQMPRLLSNLLKTLLGDGRFDAVVGALPRLEPMRLPPESLHIYANMTLAALAKAGRVDDALAVFRLMTAGWGVALDPPVAALFIVACGRASRRDAVDTLHAYAGGHDLLRHGNVSSAIVSAYDHCGDLAGAVRAFQRLPGVPDVPTHNALIGAYGHHGAVDDAVATFARVQRLGVPLTKQIYTNVLSILAKADRVPPAAALFDTMVDRGVPIDAAVLACLVSACGRASHLAVADRLYAFAADRHLPLPGNVASAFVRAFGDCARLDAALQVFRAAATAGGATTDAILTYTAMMGAYGQHGLLASALDLLDHVVALDLRPNETTLHALLVGCARQGDLPRAEALLRHLPATYRLTVYPRHVACLVDLYGRAGRLDDAERRIVDAPNAVSDSADAWVALLHACAHHGDLPRAQRAFARLRSLSAAPDADAYVRMAQVYAEAGLHDDLRGLHRDMADRGVDARPTTTVILPDRSVQVGCHDLQGDDARLQERHDALIDDLLRHGYAPDARLGLLDPGAADDDDDARRRLVCGHSEKIALAYGLMGAQDGRAPICASTSMRMCSDCHAAFKVASRVYDRAVYMRDTRRHHRFQDGQCSCRDYW